MYHLNLLLGGPVYLSESDYVEKHHEGTEHLYYEDQMLDYA